MTRVNIGRVEAGTATNVIAKEAQITAEVRGETTELMEAVQEGGRLASYLIVGIDHPDSHHTSRFDVDEESLELAVSILTESIGRIAAERP